MHEFGVEDEYEEAAALIEDAVGKPNSFLLVSLQIRNKIFSIFITCFVFLKRISFNIFVSKEYNMK